MGTTFPSFTGNCLGPPYFHRSHKLCHSYSKPPFPMEVTSVIYSKRSLCNLCHPLYCMHLIVALHGVWIFSLQQVCTTLDPADFNVKYARDAKAKQFDRAQRPHVIMGGHCYICDVQVGSKSKHCGVCNKCVSEFDHHCIWINNCVGSRNYKLFFGMISTGLLTSCTVFLIVVVLIQKYVRENNKEYTAFNGPISSNGFIALVALIGLLVLAACFLLAHLVGYHVWLNLKGLSTYDHVMLLRARQKSANNKPENSNNEHRSIKTSGQKRNRVAPATDTQPMELESGLNVLPPIKR
eukprot:m.67479 g.67479  ORF g.67479 m.67479 type:complete len:295 (-) comp11892_c0_seq1:124-1008(-)